MMSFKIIACAAVASLGSVAGQLRGVDETAFVQVGALQPVAGHVRGVSGDVEETAFVQGCFDWISSPLRWSIWKHLSFRKSGSRKSSKERHSSTLETNPLGVPPSLDYGSRKSDKRLTVGTLETDSYVLPHSLYPTNAELENMSSDSMNRLASRIASDELNARESSSDMRRLEAQQEAELELVKAQQHDARLGSIFEKGVGTFQVTSDELAAELRSSSAGGDPTPDELIPTPDELRQLSALCRQHN